MELVQRLKRDGIAKGLCQLWQNKLMDGVSMKRLINLYIRGIDFCIKNDYPTLEFIRENFKGKCEPYGVYVDDLLVNQTNKPNVVLEGNCKAELLYNGYSVSKAFIRHSSRADVTAYGNAHVTIDLFDNAHLDLVVAGTKARVLVNVYGDASASFKGTGVKVVFKHKKTY